jgi:hypothetical protein
MLSTGPSIVVVIAIDIILRSSWKLLLGCCTGCCIGCCTGAVRGTFTGVSEVSARGPEGT